MQSKEILYSLILLAGVFISALSQVMLKKAAEKQYDSFIKEYLNPLVVIAYLLFFGTTLVAVVAYKIIPLSLGPVLEATSYIYITIFGVLIFKEKMNIKKVLSICLIICGIVVYALLG